MLVLSTSAMVLPRPLAVQRFVSLYTHPQGLYCTLCPWNVANRGEVHSGPEYLYHFSTRCLQRQYVALVLVSCHVRPELCVVSIAEVTS